MSLWSPGMSLWSPGMSLWGCGMSLWACGMRCAVLREGSGGLRVAGVAGSTAPIVLCAGYAMSGTEIAYGGRGGWA
eukprot:760870-Rhodomonas_salina.1